MMEIEWWLKTKRHWVKITEHFLKYAGWYILAILAGVVIFIFILSCLTDVPILTKPDPKKFDYSILDSGAMRNIILLLAGFGALYGLVLGVRRQKHNDRTFNLDQLSRGSDLLSQADVGAAVAAGFGILKRLRKINPSDSDLIADILQSFIIKNSGNSSHHTKGITETILFELSTIRQEKGETYKIDLKGAYFKGLDLSGINLKGANLRGVRLVESHLDGKARLEGTNFEFADVSGTDFKGARFSQTKEGSQKQVDGMIYEQNNPPKNLPDNIQLRIKNEYLSNSFEQGNEWTKKYETKRIDVIREKLLEEKVNKQPKT